MSTQISRKRALGVLLVAMFFAGNLAMVAAGRVYAQPKTDHQASAPVIVNINKAGAEELDKVRGIGPAMAQRIIEFRDQNGPFKTVDDLVQVRGIGGSKLQKIKDQITV